MAPHPSNFRALARRLSWLTNDIQAALDDNTHAYKNLLPQQIISIDHRLARLLPPLHKFHEYIKKECEKL